MHITPYLPPTAEAMVRAWEKTGGPVVVVAFRRAESDTDACPNCGGTRGVYLYFMEPHWHDSPNPDGRVVSKYIEGDGRYHRGWYYTSRKETFPCPHCEKMPKRDKPYVRPPQAMIGRLAKVMGSKEQLDDQV